MTEVTRCGYVAIIGRPNVGKSTLLNAILGKKVSITSDKPQTTRSQILGIKTENHAQAIYIDTPGMHNENKAANRYMNRLASGVIADADVILFMVDATRWMDEDEVIFSKVKHATCPVILVLNKVDKLKDKSALLPVLEKLQEKFSFAQIVPTSALHAQNVVDLEKDILALLPKGPYLFPEDQVTDKSGEFQAAELIREKIMRATGQEIPYSIKVEIDSYVVEEKLIRISAIIWVDRESQKPIIIGKNGERLKKIGMQARKDMEVFLNKKVFLRLWIKVKSGLTTE